ncbi:MAG: segregation and condensation protein A [Gammaproteobacteria bacterium RIFCSPHIGHO2_12_FULL_41_20]|nr:MAG: segregation and condensation protein A [Gammaproteobacteria bacterium RIFCSPHIGHO2_12_FULL_41_20]
MNMTLDTAIDKPFAIVNGQRLASMPLDLYIPPDAMRIFLEAFEGPFDLLLYLIKKQNIDILNIPITEVTRQYIKYVDLMRELSIELAAEYLVMAAILAEIKSRMLLPKPETTVAEEEDPRAELVRRLQEYERFKQAAESLDKLPRQERDTFLAHAETGPIAIEKPKPTVNLQEVLRAFLDVLQRAELQASHQIQLEPLSVRERMSHILSLLTTQEHICFTRLFRSAEGKIGVVVSFLAMLELLKEKAIELIQTTPFGQIHVKPVSAKAEV